MAKPRQPDPEVLESDYRIPAALGTAAWMIALVVLLAMGDRLAPSQQWWIWVCVTGIALGAFGFYYVPRLLSERAETDQRHATTDAERDTPEPPTRDPEKEERRGTPDSTPERDDD
ncbi:DUF2530 domain-containing protein [Halostreptopolyspora alba]|uniref:DUF2530 domain-containing protein n=1 Tax=Halostreptopolyspora alba TaxID=2487137 RepID=A0A3N0E822_9ACTN|nr:DUF2530 domain-containing protein [Nocardiopsaceae bacterium YIM 96095]